MRYFILASALSFLFSQTAPVFACRTIEYTELKDTPVKELLQTYCRYQKLVALEQEYLEEARRINSKAPTQTGKMLIEEHSKDLKQCLDTQMKIVSALKNRSEPSPSCE